MRHLSLIAAVLAVGCAASPPAPTPTTFEWQYKGSENYEAKLPGAGVGKRYESEIGWIDVYLFNAGRDNWLEGTSDPGFMAMFGEAAQGIIQAQKQGHYTKVTIEDPTDLVIAGHKFRHFTARFEFKGQFVESHTFMTALNGRLLKYRMSFPSPIPDAVGYITTNFIEQTVGSYETQGA
jgi:hypothetical protein